MLNQLTESEAARLLGVTTNAVRLWRRGKRVPHPSAVRLAQLIELTRILAPAAYDAYQEGLNK